MSVMATNFDDGIAYDAWMGRWSKKVGEKFLEWLAPREKLSWLDVGCGNGAFTEIVQAKCAPASILGVDPSQQQLNAANSRVSSKAIEYRIGSAQSLPFADNTFDIVVMALAINLPPDPTEAAAEMVRVTRSGGSVATYMWDIPNGGITMEPLRTALSEMKVDTPIFGEAITTSENMRALWENAGLNDVDLTRIEIELSYKNFDEFWASNTSMQNTVVRALETLPEPEIQTLKGNLKSSLPIGSNGNICYNAFANAVRGLVP